MANHANAALIQAFSQTRPHSGWNTEEETLLWQEVRQAREESRPLKSVFDSVARQTGRKPNSIRNYYYARAKEDPSQGHSPAFVPFTQQEIWDLLLTVLGAQARGMSVRACTLEMGGGDTRSMLRYQNKYRALLKSNPELVQEAVRYMKEHNIPCRDPYEQPPRRSRARQEKEELNGALSGPALVQGVANLVRLAGEVQEVRRRIELLEEAVRRLEQPPEESAASLPDAL